MTGFVNGLATIIFMAQLESFQELDWRKSFDYFDTDRDGKLTFTETTAVFARDLPTLTGLELKTEMNDIFNQTDTNDDGYISFSEFKYDEDFAIHDGHDEHKMWRTLDQGTLWVMLFYVFGSMCVVHFFPRLSKVVPSSLVSIISCLFLEHVVFRNMGIETPTVKDMATVKGGLPEFKIPDIDLDTESFMICLPTSISLALVGIIESVLTLQLVDEILEDISDSSGRCTQECLAQGVANLMSAMFQSMGGDAMIGQSTINVKSGGCLRGCNDELATNYNPVRTGCTNVPGQCLPGGDGPVCSYCTGEMEVVDPTASFGSVAGGSERGCVAAETFTAFTSVVTLVGGVVSPEQAMTAISHFLGCAWRYFAPS